MFVNTAVRAQFVDTIFYGYLGICVLIVGQTYKYTCLLTNTGVVMLTLAKGISTKSNILFLCTSANKGKHVIIYCIWKNIWILKKNVSSLIIEKSIYVMRHDFTVLTP